MGVMTDYLAGKVRDHVLRNTVYTSPTTVYLALFTTPTTKGGGGAEVAGGSYARQSIAFTAGSAGLGTQTADVTFTGLPSCTVTHLALMDHVSNANNMLVFGSLLTPRIVTAGQPLTFSAGDIRILFD